MNTLDFPLVSVVIPAFNSANFLSSSVPSVLAQTFSDFELIIVNDGSTDNTIEYIQSTFTDPRIHVISQANRGLAGARNTGIRAAIGQYIALLDADDLWHPEKLQRHVEHLNSRPNVGVSYSASIFINDEGEEVRLIQKPRINDIKSQDVFLRNPVGNGSAPVIRRTTFDDIAFDAPTGACNELWYFDENLRQSEDIECWLRITLTTNWLFEGIPGAFTYYRISLGGLSAALDKQLATWEHVVTKTRRIAPEFINKYEFSARGYQLRYLSRRALTMGDAIRAEDLILRALKMHPRMILQEPVRTVMTLVAIFAKKYLPPMFFKLIFSCATYLVGTVQRLSR